MHRLKYIGITWNYQSINLSLGLPFGLLPSTSPSFTCFVHHPFPISANLYLHYSSCLFLTTSNTSTGCNLLICDSVPPAHTLNSSQYNHLSGLDPRSRLLLLSGCPCFTSIHTYISTDIIIALATFNFVCLLSSLDLLQELSDSCLQ